MMMASPPDQGEAGPSNDDEGDGGNATKRITHRIHPDNSEFFQRIL